MEYFSDIINLEVLLNKLPLYKFVAVITAMEVTSYDFRQR